MKEKKLRFVISGGGTGGHIFPAVSIANALKEMHPDADILFVGALGRMEMQRVPAAGYRIVGLPVRGLLRPLWRLGNIRILLDFLKSKRMVKKILRDFRPDVAIGVGGYASSATLNAAYELGVPCLIQEQNSFAGLTNRTLARKASCICVAYEGMERFFPKERILLTILLIGGSLGARTLNESVLGSLKQIAAAPVQFIWQTGGYYKEHIAKELEAKGQPANLYVTDFISRMDQAYKAADLVISRAGQQHQ